MQSNSNKKQIYPYHDCSQHTNNTETNLVERGRSHSSDLEKNRSFPTNKICNRSKTRYESNESNLGRSHQSSRQRIDDIILVNITDQHTANATYNDNCAQSKPKKPCKSGKKGQTAFSIKNGKTIMRAKYSVKENNPNNVGKSKKGVVVTCKCKIRPTELMPQRNLENTISSDMANVTQEDPIKNTLHLTNQIKTNINSIRVQSNKRMAPSLPQNKSVVTKGRPEFWPNSAVTTSSYLQQLRDEINANRNLNKICPSSCISRADPEIDKLHKEILQYKLKSEQDLPQAVVIEVSYINDDKDCKSIESEIASQKYPLSSEMPYRKQAEYQHNCEFKLTDYSNIAEKPIVDEELRTEKVTFEKEDDVMSQQLSNNKDSFESFTVLPAGLLQECDSPKGVVKVSIKDKMSVNKGQKRKIDTPGANDEESAGYADDDVDEEKDNKPSYKYSNQNPIASQGGAHENTFLNERLSGRNINKPYEDNTLLNESFLREQIDGMKKIDKLVEEAEQSITKVVKGFDKLFKQSPSKSSRPSTDSDTKRKNIEFNLDETCDCPDTLRCDCETIDGSDSNISFLSDVQTTEPNSEHLNTISERTETGGTSVGTISRNEIKSDVSGIVPNNDDPLHVRNIKKDANITIDTRNIVHISPMQEPFEVAPILQKTATETDNIRTSLQTNALDLQILPGVEIRPCFVIQKVYNINIKPTGSLTDQSDFSRSKNTVYIELKHDDPALLQMIDSENNSFTCVSEKDQEIQIIKAPNTGMLAQVSQVPSNQKIVLNCYGCEYSKGLSQNKNQNLEQLLNDIKNFELPVVTAISSNLHSDGSSVSEYVEVQDNATQVSVEGSKTPSQLQIGACASSGNNTDSNTLPTNVRPLIPGLSNSSHLPLLYDNEEVDEMLISIKTLEGSDVTPFDLSKKQDSRIIQKPQSQKVNKELSAVAVAPVRSEDKALVLKNDTRTNSIDDLQYLIVQDHDSLDFIAENCSIESMVCVKKTNSSSLSDISCLANAFDYNTFHSGSGLSITCVEKVTDNKNDNEEELLVNGVLRYSKNESEVMNVCEICTKKVCVNAQIEPNQHFSEDEPPISHQVERPITFKSHDLVYSVPNNFVTNTNTLTATLAMDIEGVQIMEPVFESPQRPKATQKNANTTTMAALVEYNQQRVSESLAQNLLLAQLKDSVPTPPTVVYHQMPAANFESSDSDNSSYASNDYSERYKCLIRAKRRNLSYPRGIITEPEHVKNRDKDQLSDGEVSQYTSSTGEILPIGPRLLKNRNFMRRRPDKIFQMELMQRDMHVQRQYNYFNNWVSYYVEKNSSANS